jgi:hypothetical protein
MNSLARRLVVFALASGYFAQNAEAQVHDVGFLVNVGSIILITILLAAGFGNDMRWRNFQRTAVALTAVVLLAFVLQILTLHRGAPYGYANRFFILALFAWFFGISIRLRALPHA